jgi:hypothetical protein
VRGENDQVAGDMSGKEAAEPEKADGVDGSGNHAQQEQRAGGRGESHLPLAKRSAADDTQRRVDNEGMDRRAAPLCFPRWQMPAPHYSPKEKLAAATVRETVAAASGAHPSAHRSPTHNSEAVGFTGVRFIRRREPFDVFLERHHIGVDKGTGGIAVKLHGDVSERRTCIN